MELKNALPIKDGLNGKVGSVLLLPDGSFLLACMVDKRSLDTREAAALRLVSRHVLKVEPGNGRVGAIHGLG